MYPQGDKEKYWFGYREKRFEQLDGCNELHLILVGRYKKAVVIDLKKQFLDDIKNKCNVSLDDEGNIKHYHIVTFMNPDGKFTMLLSHPEIKEIDLSDHIIGII